jgi:hypothetical protein
VEQHLPDPTVKIPTQYKSSSGGYASPELTKTLQAIDKKERDGFTREFFVRFITDGKNIVIIYMNKDKKFEQLYYTNGNFNAWCVEPPQVSEIKSRFEFQDVFYKFHSGLKTALFDYPLEEDLKEKKVESIIVSNNITRLTINQNEQLTEADAIASNYKKLFNKSLTLSRNKCEISITKSEITGIKTNNHNNTLSDEWIFSKPDENQKWSQAELRQFKTEKLTVKTLLSRIERRINSKESLLILKNPMARSKDILDYRLGYPPIHYLGPNIPPMEKLTALHQKEKSRLKSEIEANEKIKRQNLINTLILSMMIMALITCIFIVKKKLKEQ